MAQAQELEMPGISRVKDQLHFFPDTAQIFLGGQRLLLLHTAAFQDLRNELIASLGTHTARALLTRIGYSSGVRDAEIALQMQAPGDTVADLLSRGAHMHALQGVALVEMIRSDVDVDQGRCYLEFSWKNSFEAEIHRESHGLATTPACWLEMGYASGFVSTTMGKLILAREIECRAMGHQTCRVIAKPASEWADAELDLQYLEAPIPSPNRAAANTAGERGKERRKAAAQSPSQSLSQSKSKSEIVGLSPAFQAVVGKINRVATTGATVLLLGESGVGKSAFARLLHEQSHRAGQPFVAINCAAIPETLMEAELFGVERGAYTGADAARAGRFELAEGGTLFLDEVGTLPLIAQSKLLRVLETGQFERLGSGTSRHANVRIVAATNEDLWSAVRAGRFREDLFFRLNVFPIEIPPLRQRKEDIPVLIEHFMERFSGAYDRKVKGTTPEAMAMLLSYQWPGNIRELSNVVERAVILSDESRPLDLPHLIMMKGLAHTPPAPEPPAPLPESRTGPRQAALPAPAADAQPDNAAAIRNMIQRDGLTLEQVENLMVSAALEQTGGNISRAASLLGITRGQLSYRQKRL